MPLQIANPVVVDKIERLAKATGLSKTAVVERALDRLIGETTGRTHTADRMATLLAQLDRIPDRGDAFDPLVWDEHGGKPMPPMRLSSPTARVADIRRG